MPPAAVTVSASDRDRSVGTFALDDGSQITLAANGSGITATSSNVTMFGGLPGLTPPGGRRADLEKKTMAILEEASKDNFRPIFEAFNDDRAFELVQGNQRRFWAGWRAELGEFKRFELLGVAPVQGDPAVTVRAEFARGSKILQLIWGPRRLAGFMTPDAGSPVTLTPESATTWSYFAYSAPSVIRVTVDGDSISVASGTSVVKGKRRAAKLF
jgi:hypothetical protein